MILLLTSKSELSKKRNEKCLRRKRKLFFNFIPFASVVLTTGTLSPQIIPTTNLSSYILLTYPPICYLRLAVLLYPTYC